MSLILRGQASGRRLAAILLLGWLVPAPAARAAPGAPATIVRPSAETGGVVVVRGGFGWGNRHWTQRERRAGTGKAPRRKYP